MKVLTAVDLSQEDHLTKLDKFKNMIFLAGPCPRKDYEKEDVWRNEAIQILDELGFEGCVLNPTNPEFDKIDLERQTAWEAEGLHKASAIVFWIDRSKEHPAFTTNIEFGEWYKKRGVYVGAPDTAIKNDYLKIKIKSIGKTWYNDLRDLLENVVKDLNNDGKEITFFTSDTHFSQERTLELSRRPFIDIKDMDLNLISNWNKKVKMNDTVIHLGDFGESFNYLDVLNFKELYLIPGNYEYKQYGSFENIKEAAEKHANVFVVKPEDVRYLDGSNKTSFTYMLTHEPIYKCEYPENSFFLFGHIHGRSVYKRNGVDVGVDSFGWFEPFSMSEIAWEKDAVLKYVDENVFVSTVRKGEQNE